MHSAPDRRARAVHLRRRQLLQAQQALCLQLEQALARGQPDVVAALGQRRPQPRALAARQQQHRQLALRNEAQPRLAPLLALLVARALGGAEGKDFAFKPPRPPACAAPKAANLSKGCC